MPFVTVDVQRLQKPEVERGAHTDAATKFPKPSLRGYCAHNRRPVQASSNYFVLDAKRFTMTNDDNTTKSKLPAGVLLQTGKNYSAWSTRIKSKLEEEDLWEVVAPIADGGQAVPAANATAAVKKKWRMDNAKAKGVIFKLLDDTMTTLHGGEDLARNVWSTLRAEFMREGETDRSNARTELGKLRHKHTSEISELLRELERLFLVFTHGTNPQPLTNGEKIGYAISILRATGGRWRQIADVQEGLASVAAPGVVHRWEDFKAKLQREQRDRDAHVGGWANEFNPAVFKNKFQGAQGRAYLAAVEMGLTEEQAMVVVSMNGGGENGGGVRTRGGRNDSANNGSDGPICHKCSKRGHMRHQCRSQKWCSDCKTNDHAYGLCPNSTGRGFRGDVADRKRRRLSGESSAAAANVTQDSGDTHDLGGLSVDDFVKAHALTASHGKLINDYIAAARKAGGICMSPSNSAQAWRASWSDHKGWLIDSGASNHMTPFATDFLDRNEIKAPPSKGGVRIADDKVIPIVGIGDATIIESNSTLPNTLHVPQLGERLASINAWSQEDLRVTFIEGGGPCLVTRPNKAEKHLMPPGEVIITGHHDGQLWRVSNSSSPAHRPSLISDSSLAFVVNLELFHQRYGHIGVARLKHAITEQLARKYEKGYVLDAKRREVMRAALGFCELCELANSKKKPARRSGSKVEGTSSRATDDNYRFYMDACIVNVVARTGAVCFVVLVDCKSRWGHYAGLRARKDVYEMFVDFQAKAERQMQKPIKRMRCDNAPEYVYGRLGEHFKKEGVQLELTSKGTSSMNAPAERRIQSITGMIRVMIAGASLDDTYWDDAGMEANELINELPTSSLPGMQSPSLARFGIQPDLSTIRVWGCPAYVHLLPVDRDSKVGQRSVKTIHLGRVLGSNGRLYKCLDTATGAVIKSAHVSFDETMTSGYGQGRVNRGLPGATSLQFRSADGVDVEVNEYAPQSTTIVGDNDAVGELIPQSRVIPLTRPAAPGADVFAPPREAIIRIDESDFEHHGEFDIEPAGEQRPQASVDATDTPIIDTAATLPRRSERAPVPAQRGSDFVWGTSPLLQPGLQVHHNPDAGLTGPAGATASAAEAYHGFFASKDDVSSTLDELERRGMGLETVAMACISATTEHRRVEDTNVRPMIMAMAGITGREPRNIIEIASFDEPERSEWRKATQEEYDALMKNETWELVPRPEGRKVTRCKWVFKLKRGGNGEVTRYKARLVAQGFTQQYGIDYHETWAPTMSAVSMRSILAIGNAKGWRRLKQGDVPNAYLKARLQHEVLMEQPQGFAEAGKEGWVCRLLKALYGLKQAGMEWNAQITNKLVNEWGYVQSRVDGCVFSRRDANGLVALFGLYVDDCLAYLRDEEEEKRIGKHMLDSYGVILDDVDYFCGIKIERDLEKRRLFLSQEAYVDRVVKEFDDSIGQSKPPRTPADTSARLTKEQAPKTDAERLSMSRKPYSRLVGALLWVAMMTRPDICDQVHKLSQFIRDPGEAHWDAALRVVRYLKGSKRHGIMFDGAGITFAINEDGTETLNQPVTFYCDADYAGDTDNRKSTSGLLASIAGAFIMWRAKKQGGVTLNTMEAELVSMGTAVQESEGLTAGLLEMGIRTTPPAIINEDNQAAILHTKDGRNQSKARHIGVRFYYIRENVKDGKVKIVYCPTAKMLADIMTKAIPADQFEYLRNGIGVVDVSKEISKTLGDNGTKALVAISGKWECRDY